MYRYRTRSVQVYRVYGAVQERRLACGQPWPYASTARGHARHLGRGTYELIDDRGLLLERFTVLPSGDLLIEYPPPEPPPARVAALLPAA